MRTSSELCQKKKHGMHGDNLLWHTRYSKTGQRFMVRECRACANARYRTQRLARKRNQELDRLAKAS